MPVRVLIKTEIAHLEKARDGVTDSSIQKIIDRRLAELKRQLKELECPQSGS